MTVDLNSLSPNALRAAMQSGTAGWGQWASASEHVRYIQPIDPKSQRRCHCGCKQRATHLGMANGLALTQGCELSMRRWAAGK